MAFSYHVPRHVDGNYCVSPDDMRAWEGAEIEAIPNRGRELMEIAGRSVAMCVLERYPETREVLIFCGPGNNGGDGYVAAWYLSRSGISVKLFSFEGEDKRGDDARYMQGRVRELPSVVIASDADFEGVLSYRDRRGVVVIDAIYGTGFKDGVDPLVAGVCDVIARLGCPVVSVDVPSGIDAHTGRRGIYSKEIEADGIARAVTASDTVTFGAPKLGHFLGDGPACCGNLWCADIGLQAYPQDRMRMAILSDEWCARAYWQDFERQISAHKGRCGHVGVVGGHARMPGASSLCGRAALASGAGLVSIGARAAYRAPDELMVDALCSEDCLKGDALAEFISRVDCLVVGPGLGRGGTGLEIVERCASFGGPLVLDADALWAAAALELSFDRDDVFMTPHIGEAAKLLGVTGEEISLNPARYARDIAERFGATVILKSHATVIAQMPRLETGVLKTPEGGLEIVPVRKGEPRLGILPYPNAAIATAGAGDVLAGILGGLLGQCRCGAVGRHYDAFEIAAMAVNAHSAAGRRAAERRGNSACASDIIAEIRL
ncbi:MAG: NAD(P)H-hydrate epimerase [Proteobacteria bacterium]|nr:NAD(P)H-hydrate epimerase [Pseudomonadota bacterium]